MHAPNHICWLLCWLFSVEWKKARTRRERGKTRNRGVRCTYVCIVCKYNKGNNEGRTVSGKIGENMENEK